MKRHAIPVLCVGLLLSCAAVSAQNAPAQELPPSGVIDSHDPLLEPPPLPGGKPSLVGGTVVKTDGVRNTIVVKPFGGSNMKIHFDERTHIYRDGVETTHLGIRRNDRVYVDTLLDGTRVFAKNIRVQTRSNSADARGQIVSYKNGRLTVQDELSSEPVTFALDQQTVISREGRAVSASDLQPGALIEVSFDPKSAARGVARTITINAVPGSVFRFSGRITYLDLKSGILAIQNQSDDRNYEIHFEPDQGDYSSLGVGSDVNVETVFDGRRYSARKIAIVQAKSE